MAGLSTVHGHFDGHFAVGGAGNLKRSLEGVEAGGMEVR